MRWRMAPLCGQTEEAQLRPENRSCVQGLSGVQVCEHIPESKTPEGKEI